MDMLANINTPEFDVDDDDRFPPTNAATATRVYAMKATALSGTLRKGTVA